VIYDRCIHVSAGTTIYISMRPTAGTKTTTLVKAPTMYVRAVLISLILGPASATHCTTYPCICDDNLEQAARGDGVCVKVGKPCAGSECFGVRPHLNESRCADVAAEPV